MSKFEKVQLRETKWILETRKSYKERLLHLKILPLSWYVEMHDLLLLLALKLNAFDVKIDISKVNTDDLTRQQSREYKLHDNRLHELAKLSFTGPNSCRVL